MSARRILAPRSRQPTKSQLVSLLLDLGFKRHLIRGSHLMFKKGTAMVCLRLGPKLLDANYLSTLYYLEQRGEITREFGKRWLNGR